MNERYNGPDRREKETPDQVYAEWQAWPNTYHSAPDRGTLKTRPSL